MTGITGMIGRAVADRLSRHQHQVRGIARPSSDVTHVEYDVAIADFGRPESLRAALEGVDTLVHCAAVYAYGRSQRADVEDTNIDGTRQLVEAAREAGVRRIVVTSSSVTCGSSADGTVRCESDHIDGGYVPIYYLSKLRQEHVALEAAGDDVEVLFACPTVVMGGPAARLVPSNAIILRYLLDYTRSTFPGGCNVVSVDDVADAHVLLAEQGVPGERYLVAAENLSWRTLHSTIADLAGVAGPRLEISTAATYLVSAIAESWARFAETEPLSTRDEALTVGRYYWYSHDKIAALGYRPEPARFAIAQALAWLLGGPDIPRWVREGLRPVPEVRAARRLLPRPL